MKNNAPTKKQLRIKNRNSLLAYILLQTSPLVLAYIVYISIPKSLAVNLFLVGLCIVGTVYAVRVTQNIREQWDFDA